MATRPKFYASIMRSLANSPPLTSSELSKQILHLKILLLFSSHIVDDFTFVHHDQTVTVYDGIFHIMSYHHGGQLILSDDLVTDLQYFLLLSWDPMLRYVHLTASFWPLLRPPSKCDSLTLTTGQKTYLAGHTVLQSQSERL